MTGLYLPTLHSTHTTSYPHGACSSPTPKITIDKTLVRRNTWEYHITTDLSTQKGLVSWHVTHLAQLDNPFLSYVFRREGYLPDTPLAVIDNFYPNGLYAAPHTMRQGIGTRVLDHILADALEEACVLLCGTTQSRSMQSFLQKQHFTFVNEEDHYFLLHEINGRKSKTSLVQRLLSLLKTA